MDKDNDDQPALFPGVFHPKTLDEEPDQSEPIAPHELENEGQKRLF